MTKNTTVKSMIHGMKWQWTDWCSSIVTQHLNCNFGDKYLEIYTRYLKKKKRRNYNITRQEVPQRLLPQKPAEHHSSAHTLLTRVALGGERSTMERETAVLSPTPSPPTTPPLPRSKRGIWTNAANERKGVRDKRGRKEGERAGRDRCSMS